MVSFCSMSLHLIAVSFSLESLNILNISMKDSGFKHKVTLNNLLYENEISTFQE